MAQFQQRELSDGGADAQLQVEQRIASNNRVAKTVSGGGRGMEMDGEQCEGAAARQRQASRWQGEAREQQGVWVDPATQQLGRIAEIDPGAYAFGKG